MLGKPEDCLSPAEQKHSAANIFTPMKNGAENSAAAHKSSQGKRIGLKKKEAEREEESDLIERLRMQFVAKAKSYVGKKYDALDCCGLVRECVHKLSHFGFRCVAVASTWTKRCFLIVSYIFRLDRCNQGVMFDTLNRYFVSLYFSSLALSVMTCQLKG